MTATAARRNIRTTARHIAHISKDAGPLALQQLHADLGRAIADLATANYQEHTRMLDEIRERRPELARTIEAGFEVLDEQAGQ